MGELENFDLEKYEEEAKKIAQKIADEQIKFEGIVSQEYLRNKNIFESIVAVNPELLKEEKNRDYLHLMTAGMTDQEIIEYYQKIGVPFNRDTVISNNLLSVVECLKNDHMTLSNTQKLYKKKEYKQIYDQIKGELKPEEILESEFLTQNPYFVNDLIKSGVDLSKVDLSKTKYYDEYYLALKTTAIKYGVSIPEPKNYNDIIKFSEDNQIFVELDSLENVNRGLKYIKEEKIDQELTIQLRQENFDEFVISDNIEYFEKLAKNNVNINFKYDTGDRVFSLKEILDNEHFLQQATEDIKNKNFSPLEQLIAVYDIAKVFKPYKGNNELGSAVSRSLYEYLGNEYMVCSGYSDLVANLGHRLNLNVSKFGLYLNGVEPHNRNYVNLVDPKYGIDGFYAIEPTWEQNGKLREHPRRKSYEQVRSTYADFLLTTEEGRHNYTGGKIRVEDYDAYFTSTTPEELRKSVLANKNGNNIQNVIEKLDPEFAKTFNQLDINKDEDAYVVLDYFKTKVNNTFPKEALLDAVINVKKTVYLNFNDQDFEDMRMGYSLTKPFSIDEFDSNGILKSCSLYGKKYDEYAERRYNDIKSETLDNANKNNPCLNANKIVEIKKIKELKDDKVFSGYNADNSLSISNKEMIQLLLKNAEKVEKIGFKIDYYAPEEDMSEELKLTFPQDDKKEMTIEEQIEGLKKHKKELYIALGLEKEKSRTQLLGKQTLDEQNDTKGKSVVQNEMNRQIENIREQEEQFIQ